MAPSLPNDIATALDAAQYRIWQLGLINARLHCDIARQPQTRQQLNQNTTYLIQKLTLELNQHKTLLVNRHQMPPSPNQAEQTMHVDRFKIQAETNHRRQIIQRNSTIVRSSPKITQNAQAQLSEQLENTKQGLAALTAQFNQISTFVESEIKTRSLNGVGNILVDLKSLINKLTAKQPAESKIPQLCQSKTLFSARLEPANQELHPISSATKPIAEIIRNGGYPTAPITATDKHYKTDPTATIIGKVEQLASPQPTLKSLPVKKIPAAGSSDQESSDDAPKPIAKTLELSTLAPAGADVDATVSPETIPAKKTLKSPLPIAIKLANTKTEELSQTTANDPLKKPVGTEFKTPTITKKLPLKKTVAPSDLTPDQESSDDAPKPIAKTIELSTLAPAGADVDATVSPETIPAKKTLKSPLPIAIKLANTKTEELSQTTPNDPLKKPVGTEFKTPTIPKKLPLKKTVAPSDLTPDQECSPTGLAPKEPAEKPKMLPLMKMALQKPVDAPLDDSETNSITPPKKLLGSLIAVKPKADPDAPLVMKVPFKKTEEAVTKNVVEPTKQITTPSKIPPSPPSPNGGQQSATNDTQKCSETAILKKPLLKKDLPPPKKSVKKSGDSCSPSVVPKPPNDEDEDGAGGLLDGEAVENPLPDVVGSDDQNDSAKQSSKTQGNGSGSGTGPSTQVLSIMKVPDMSPLVLTPVVEKFELKKNEAKEKPDAAGETVAALLDLTGGIQQMTFEGPPIDSYLSEEGDATGIVALAGDLISRFMPTQIAEKKVEAKTEKVVEAVHVKTIETALDVKGQIVVEHSLVKKVLVKKKRVIKGSDIQGDATTKSSEGAVAAGRLAPSLPPPRRPASAEEDGGIMSFLDSEKIFDGLSALIDQEPRKVGTSVFSGWGGI